MAQVFGLGALPTAPAVGPVVLAGLALGRPATGVLGGPVGVDGRDAGHLEKVCERVALLALAVPLVNTSGHDSSYLQRASYECKM